MSMPTIPDINPELSINREDAINIIIASIAMEELSLAHILNAEGEKLQYVLGTLEGRDPGEITLCDIMMVNKSIQKTLKDVIKSELLLQFKLESVIEIAENEEECPLTISGEKIWRDGGDIDGTRPEYVIINLLRDNEVYKTVRLDAKGNCKYTFPCLPVWKDAEHSYSYRIDEVDVPGYSKTIRNYDVINTVEPGSINISGSKTWIDENNANQLRPDSITINLLQNGTQIDSIEIDTPPDTESTQTFAFNNVPRFDANGNPYNYALAELSVNNYHTEINGYNITNTLSISP